MFKRQKIVFVSAFPPNDLTAGQYFSKILVNELANHFEVDLITFPYKNHQVDVTNSVKIEILKLSLWNKLKNACLKFYLHPIFTVRYNKTYSQLINKRALEADYIFFDFSQVLIYDLMCSHPNKFIRLHDVIFQKYTRGNLLNRMQLLWVKATEKYLLRNCDTIFSISKKDSNLLLNQYNKQSIVFNYALKPIHFNFNDIEIKNDEFCLYGAWNRMENEEGLMWFIDKVLPQLKSNIKIKIIGPGLSKNVLQKMNNCSNISYLGFVDNPLLEIYQVAALIAPVFSGAGIKIKVIDSLSVGTPIIGSEVAFEGIDNKQYLPALNLCANANDYIHAINSFSPWTKEQKITFINNIQANHNEFNFVDMIIKEASN